MADLSRWRRLLEPVLTIGEYPEEMAYFVRQRDLYQRRSDDLLHAILPDEIVPRLKDGSGTIADDDIPRRRCCSPTSSTSRPCRQPSRRRTSSSCSNEVFSCFDAFVADLGLEKIKTVGDAYMAAAGVPRARADHAHAIAELALRIRDHEAMNPVDGGRLMFRVGVNSGPVTAGVIGTRTFSYDLVGRHREHGEPHGIVGRARRDPDHR
jgi:adenylate cyclase